MKISKKSILVVCHDAGAAEVISAYVKKRNPRQQFLCVALGPAGNIFKQKGLSRLMISRGKGAELLKQSGIIRMLLCGTSWASDVERDFIGEARAADVKSVAYLDHWVHYRERFGYPKKDWQKNLPNEIWVGDKHAYKLAKKFFKKIKVALIKNGYYEEMKNAHKAEGSKLKSAPRNILFMSEPLGAADDAFGNSRELSDEHKILESILKQMVKNNISDPLVICYHPADRKDKYNVLIRKYNHLVNIRKQSASRVKDLAEARIVIGMKSMALAVALMCGKKVVSFLPSARERCPIPFPGITRIKKISDLSL